jgi:multiple sugar transport system permease protein
MVIYDKPNKAIRLTRRKKRTDLYPYIMVLPGLLLMAVFIVYPVFSNIILSFSNYSMISREHAFVGIDNYIDLLTSGRFLNSINFTIIWTITNIFFTLIIGLITAVVLDTDFKGSFILKSIILIPWVLPQIVTGYVFTMMLSQNIGIVNEFLIHIGLVDADFSWFQTGNMASVAVIIASIWRGFPFNALMIYAKLRTINKNLIEAAEIDGANDLHVFLHITIPHIRSIIITCLTLNFIWSFNAYDIVRVMTEGGPGESTALLAFLIQKDAFLNFELSKAATESVIAFILMLLILFIATRLIKMTLHRRGVK